MRYFVIWVAVLLVSGDDTAARKKAPDVEGAWYRNRHGEQPDLRVTFTREGRMIYDDGKGPDFGWYQLDRTADPPEITLALPHQANADNRLPPYLGIYTLEGDTLTIYMSAKERPTEYEAVRGSGVYRMKLQRAGTEQRWRAGE